MNPRSALILSLLTLCAGSGFAQAPIQVGEHQPTQLAIDYLDEGSWEQVIQRPDAAYIKVSFARMDLQPGDVIQVTDPDGRYLWSYPGSRSTVDGGAGFWALSIPGDTAVIRLVKGATEADLDSPIYRLAREGAPLTELGADIDRIARGFSEQELDLRYGRLESTCGANERADVACWESSHPVEFGKADAVARILQNGSSHCTGWRLFPGAHLMTNEHCITSQAQLNNMEFWFNYQKTECGGPDLEPITIVTGDQFLVDDFTHDFALVTITDPATVESFGHFTLDVRTPILGEEIYLPQHGAGNPKEFGIDSDLNPPNNLCQIDLAIADGRGTDTDTGYMCDTTGGSSGSPVLARSSHQVIAIHHFGTGLPHTNCDPSLAVNQGVRIELIWPFISSFFQDIFADGFESGDLGFWTIGSEP